MLHSGAAPTGRPAERKGCSLDAAGQRAASRVGPSPRVQHHLTWSLSVCVPGVFQITKQKNAKGLLISENLPLSPEFDSLRLPRENDAFKCQG